MGFPSFAILYVSPKADKLEGTSPYRNGRGLSTYLPIHPST